MSFSLADCILRYRESGARRSSSRQAPREDVAASAPEEEIARLRSLFGDVCREWSGLVLAVGGLKEALARAEHDDTFAGLRGHAAIPASMAVEGEGPPRVPLDARRLAEELVRESSGARESGVSTREDLIDPLSAAPEPAKPGPAGPEPGNSPDRGMLGMADQRPGTE